MTLEACRQEGVRPEEEGEGGRPLLFEGEEKVEGP
jgi:hypothetical protein